MSSRIVRANQTIWRSKDFELINWRRGFPEKVRGRGASREVTRVDCTVAIPASDPASPFRAGVALRDLDEELVYRVVHHLPPDGGWASTEFWQDRYKIRHRDVITFARAGFLDPAMEEASQVRRYRCRDEQRLKRDPIFKKIKARAVKAKHNKKRRSK